MAARSTTPSGTSQKNGQTNVNELALACGVHNRLVTEGGWTTTIAADGTVHWHPPTALDAAGPRANLFHHPEKMVAKRPRESQTVTERKPKAEEQDP